MWEISTSQQIFGFLCPVAVGMLLGMLYDFFRAFRRAFHPSPLHTFFADLIFAFFAAFVCFCLEIALTAGQVRFYFLAGIASGFLTERGTVSRFFCNFLVRLLRLIAKGISVLSAVFRRVIGRFEAKMWIFFKKNAQFSKKIAKTFKKVLKIR